MTDSDLTADLPAPRDDEPASLRDDIVDELRDHLECALRRERLKGGAGNDSRSAPHPGPLPLKRGEGDAVQRVLAKFGDPAAVARKLWWDAMREKIMGQRLMTAMTALALLVCCAMAGLMWQMNAAQGELLRASQAANAAFLERLSRQETVAPRNYDWCNCRIKLVQDGRDGPPMTAAKVVLLKLQGGETDNSRSYPGVPQQPDTDGQVEFSPVPYGFYYLVVRTDGGDLFKEEIVIRPGMDYERTIVCPMSPPTGKVVPAAISTVVMPPDDLRDRLWVLYRIGQWQFHAWSSLAGSTYELSNGGTRLDGDRWQMAREATVLIGPTGDMYPVEWPETEAQPVPSGHVITTGFSWPPLQPSLSVTSLPSPIKALELPAGEYRTQCEFVLHSETPEPGQAATWTLLDEETRLRVEQARQPVPEFVSPVVTASETITLPLIAGQESPTDGQFISVYHVPELADVIPNPTSLAQPMGGGFGGGGFGGGGFF